MDWESLRSKERMYNPAHCEEKDIKRDFYPKTNYYNAPSNESSYPSSDNSVNYHSAGMGIFGILLLPFVVIGLAAGAVMRNGKRNYDDEM